MPENCQSGSYQNGFVLRAKEIWFQKEIVVGGGVKKQLSWIGWVDFLFFSRKDSSNFIHLEMGCAQYVIASPARKQVSEVDVEFINWKFYWCLPFYWDLYKQV